MGVFNREHRTRYKDVSGRTTLAAGDNLSAAGRTLVALKVGYTTYVEKIQVNVITDNAATLQFKDSAGTPRVIAGTKASPGIGPITFEFGDEGIPLTEAKDFNLWNSAAGLAAEIYWEGYQKPTGTLTTAQV